MQSAIVLTSAGACLLIGTVESLEQCRNRNDYFQCERGCCGDYREERCCSLAGFIVGIVVGVALFIGIIGALIYCYMKKRAKKQRRLRAAEQHQERQQIHRNNIAIIRTQQAMAYNAASAQVFQIPAYHEVGSPKTQPAKSALPPAYEEYSPPPPYSPAPVVSQGTVGINSLQHNDGPPPVS